MAQLRLPDNNNEQPHAMLNTAFDRGPEVSWDYPKRDFGNLFGGGQSKEACHGNAEEI